MKITLKAVQTETTRETQDLELVIETPAHEEGLDVLALLINAGVIPVIDEGFDFEEAEDGRPECPCDAEEVELSEEEVLETLQSLFGFGSNLEKHLPSLEELEKQAQEFQEFKEALEKAQAERVKSEAVPPELKEILDALFGILKP